MNELRVALDKFRSETTPQQDHILDEFLELSADNQRELMFHLLMDTATKLDSMRKALADLQTKSQNI